MKRVKNKNIFVILIVLLVFGFFTCFSFNKIFEKEVVTEKENPLVSIGGSDGWEFGSWEISAVLSSDSIGYEVSDNGMNLTADFSSELLEDNEVTLSFWGSLENDTLLTDFSRGDFLLNLPLYLFYTNETLYNSQVDSESNMLLFTDDSENNIGYVKLPSDILYCDFTSNDCSSYENDYLWYYDEYQLYIYNNKDMISSELDNFNFNFDLIYSFSPLQIVYNQENYVYSYISFANLEYGDFEPLVTTMNKSNDETVNLDGLSSNQEVTYDEWQSEWGEKISEYDFYTLYSIDGNIDYNSDYYMEFKSNINDGEIVSYSCGSDVFSTDLSNSNCGLLHSEPISVDYKLVVGYNFTDEAKIKNVSDSIDLKFETPFGNYNKNFSWNFTYGDTDISDINYPVGTSTDYKQTLLSDTVGIGAINNLKNKNNVNFKWLIESSAGTINSSTNGLVKAFNLWNLTEEGTKDYTINLESNGGLLDSSYSTDTNPYYLENNYIIDSFYPQDDLEYDYLLDSYRYVLNLALDYETYTEKLVYVKIDNGNYELIGSYKKDSSGNIVYTAIDNRTSSNISVSQENPIKLPEGTTEIKVSYTGKRAAVYMGININTVLKANDEVINQVESFNSESIVLKNNVSLSINDIVDNSSEGTYLTQLFADTYGVISSSLNNRVDENESITYNAYIYEQLNYGELGVDEAKKVINEQKNISIYILLPKGALLDGDLKISKYGSGEIVDYTIERYNNYKESLRTLLKINVNNDSSNYYVENNYIQSGYLITYNILYSDENNIIYGNVLNNDIAFVSSNEFSDGYYSVNDVSSSVISDNVTKSIFYDLLSESSNKNQFYETNSTIVNKVSVLSGSYTNSVKNELDVNFSNEASVVESGEYTYRLQYNFASNYEEISNVIFADMIDGKYVDDNYFKGLLKNIDISYLKSIGVNPVVYYTTDVNIDLNEIDLTSSSWTTIKPSDQSKIVAIAVDCGNYTFKGSENKSLYVDLILDAPNNYKDGIKAYNDSVINYRSVNSGSNKTLWSDTTEVSLDKATILLEASSNIGTGSIDSPSIIQNNLIYNLKLSNTSDLYNYESVEFAVEIPKGLEIINIDEKSSLVSNIKGTYNFDEETRTIYYLVSNLDENEVKDISIELGIVFDDIDFDSVLVTEIDFNKLNGREYNGNKYTFYSQLKVPSLEFRKYAKTNDVSDFSDISSMIVEKNEVYYYRISINNVSGVEANNIEIVDIVPKGLIVDESSISNNGVYDSDNSKIVWNLDSLNSKSNINLEYSVQVPDNISLGTIYKSSAHIKLSNPYSMDTLLYDDDTNIISTLYQIVSDIKIENKLDGLLANKEKEFNFVIELNGDASHTGSYDVLDSHNETIGIVNIDSNGYGIYNGKIVGDDFITIRMLPGNVNYTIKEEIAKGYNVSVNSESNVIDNNVVVSGITSEERIVSYTFTNSYDVKTSLDLGARVTYDKGIDSTSFALILSDSNGYVDQESTDSDGNVLFKTLEYNNVVGQYIYEIKQVDLGEKKISYDTEVYKVVVNITDDGEGNLNKEVKFFNKLDKEVKEMIFNNIYIPNGLIIGNINTSDYVDINKTFSYEIILSSVTGSYNVVSMDNELIETIKSDNNNQIVYKFDLKSDETIKIVDLPSGVSYKIIQYMVDYYKTDLDGLSYSVDEVNKSIVHESVTVDDTSKILFNNNYVTSAKYQPKVIVKLEDKLLEDKEFKFMIKDVSNGSTNGYYEYASNDVDGNILFSNINYNRPGKYIYEITQVKGVSNHIYYDLSKCLLTIELVDNGDGTMSVLSNVYEYLNDNNSFVNRYSEEPIVDSSSDQVVNGNPNTSDRMFIIGILFVIVVSLFVIEGRIKRRKYEMKI